MHDGNPLFEKITIEMLCSVPGPVHHVGSGFICWFKRERQTGRYGSVWLARGWADDTAVPMVIPNLGSPGRLIARVIEVVDSRLWADMFEQAREPGQLLVLGEGRSFVAEFGEPPLALGVRPTTGRKHNWLSGDNLRFLKGCRTDLLWSPVRLKKRQIRS